MWYMWYMRYMWYTRYAWQLLGVQTITEVSRPPYFLRFPFLCQQLALKSICLLKLSITGSLVGMLTFTTSLATNNLNAMELAVDTATVTQMTRKSLVAASLGLLWAALAIRCLQSIDCASGAKQALCYH